MSHQDVIKTFRSIVGKSHVLTGDRQTEPFRKGFRSGEGEVLAVVQPGTLLEQWQILKTCVANDLIVIMQAANTGLTEGSTPKGTYDREVVLINTRRMDGLQTLDGGKQVISFPGATLFALEKLLAPLGREPHSVIGSSCIGASIIGGVCNNSGGSLVERGPSYTELSLFARISEDGQLELVNHLGIELGTTPEEILSRLQQGNYSDRDMEASNRKASDTDYEARVRDVDADSPARFNADKRRLYESAGCAGKLAVFAVRLDTYPKNKNEQVFYIGTNEPSDLTELRRHILSQFETLPVSAEYMHQECYDLTEKYGKDTVVMIDKLGTDRLPTFFALKGKVDAYMKKIPPLSNLTDRVMQIAAGVWPTILPKRMRDFRKHYTHHLILKARDEGIEEAQSYFDSFFADKEGDFFACDAREGKIAGLHRFAAAGAAVRYMNIHEQKVEGILALDIALKRNDRDWLEQLPIELNDQLVSRLYYGHFLCHVLHQDYIVKKGVDLTELKAKMLEILDQRGAEYPAEHNVGHLYCAKPDLANFYKDIDPTNSLNPGLGKMSKKKFYG
ncbi:D-lactate dehydrogenase [Cohaesibacter gelatinilyticus]|uniref:Quinone-dependent D-lactate dehydrogenase n=1 Tax=Cohaesibacter gelatinilyticus TaxID=372072 RepID=A0A285PBD6_9HYPH|nr:D-lactate dehydrogenase [Cohaesibacter gelatinilyticus]SNZ19042.1 D-lactate dehydrogenase [Cohaesibacter gelatinilyticus]